MTDPSRPPSPEASSGTASPLHLKPERLPFLLSRLLGTFIFLLVVAVLLVVGIVVAELPGVAFLVPLALLGGGMGLSWWAAGVAYRKESYEIHERHLVCRRGGIFSDEHTELEVRLITHVKQRLPWIQHRLFGVGDLMIDSAGSSDSAITLRSIGDPHGLYDHVQQVMRNNGYTLSKDRLLHEESPDLLGSVLECGGVFFGSFLGIAVFLPGVVQVMIKEGAKAGLTWLVVLGGALIFVGVVVAVVLHFLDLRRRTYRVYADAIFYEEGFLTRDNAFIPSENIADGSTKRTFIDQVVGLYDVNISCQGSGQEIRFRRLRQGKQLAAAIDHVVEQERGRREHQVSTAGTSAVEAGGEHPTVAAPGRPAPTKGSLLPPQASVPADEAWTAELKMHGPRVLTATLPWLLLPPVFIIVLITQVIRLAATRFWVRVGSLRTRFQFLNVDEREFSYDKVTGVVIKRNPWDAIFETFTIQVWSIGSSQPLELAHVRRDAVNLPALLRQVGIPIEGLPLDKPEGERPSRHSFRAAFSPIAWLKASLPLAAFLVLGILGFVIAGSLIHPGLHAGVGVITVGALAGLVYGNTFYARQRCELFPQHIEVQRGILFHSHYFALYRNIKKVAHTTYPFSDDGSLQLFVAGERVAGKGTQQGGDNQKGLRVQYSFTAKYLPAVSQRLFTTDEVLRGAEAPEVLAESQPRIPQDLAPLRTCKPMLANSLTALLVGSVILFPLIVLLPITVPWVILEIRRRRYDIEPHRVVFTRGILYRVQTSVLYERVDSLRNAQGFLHKIFGNGDVTIFTAGSSKPDLVLSSLKEFREVYRDIRDRYAGT